MTRNKAMMEYVIPAIVRMWNDETCDEILEALKQEPYDDAISREDALMALTGEWTESRAEILPKAITRIKALPSVNPQEQKTGHWINHKDEHQCSMCKEVIIVNYYTWDDNEYKYCPNCGRRMVEPRESEE